MTRKKFIPVSSSAEIPTFRSDEEAAAFWETHEATAELVDEERSQREQLGLPLRGRRGLRAKASSVQDGS